MLRCGLRRLSLPRPPATVYVPTRRRAHVTAEGPQAGAARQVWVEGGHRVILCQNPDTKGGGMAVPPTLRQAVERAQAALEQHPEHLLLPIYRQAIYRAFAVHDDPSQRRARALL